jgi:wyosine [tRNA(Phe)-imidazoG37] synthetase (radical SAM superfamily)
MSLGVDLVPCKVCSFDCVYCECGDTTRVVLGREEFFPVKEVLEELEDYLLRSPVLDYITFSGSGEPTLSLSLGLCIRYLKDRFPSYRVAVLTNGSLLWKDDVRKDLLAADVVLPTLSSAIDETYRRIHRPAPGLTVDMIIDGIGQFRKEYDGEIWLEIFIIPGINSTKAELEALRDAILRIHPDRVQLNTLDRPGTEPWVRPASPGELRNIRDTLGLAMVEIVNPVNHGTLQGTLKPDWTDMEKRVHNLLQRRPSTLGDISDATGLNRREVLKILRLIGGRVTVAEREEKRGIFYSCPEGQE